MRTSATNTAAWPKPAVDILFLITVLKKILASGCVIKDVCVQLHVSLSESTMIKMKRAQDVLSQKQQKPVSLEMVFEESLSLYLEKFDPLKKKVRMGKKRNSNSTNANSGSAQLGKSLKTPRGRTPLSNSIKHQVYLNSKGQCTHINALGKRCDETKFLDIHHLRPLSQGGGNELENLTLLCKGHHRSIHLRHPEISSN